MEAKLNVIGNCISSTKLPDTGYCISSTKLHQDLFNFEALIKVFKRVGCLFHRKTTCSYQVLRLWFFFQITINSDHYDIFSYVFQNYYHRFRICILVSYAFNLVTVKLWGNL